LIATLWRYRVAEGRDGEFERIYASDGEWAALFARAPGYLGTELLRGGDRDYVTIDRWHDRSSFDDFKASLGAEYAALDAKCEVLTLDEQHLGIFEGSAG
jgi:heme-degrading monooxygenase HmoA